MHRKVSHGHLTCSADPQSHTGADWVSISTQPQNQNPSRSSYKVRVHSKQTAAERQPQDTPIPVLCHCQERTRSLSVAPFSDCIQTAGGGRSEAVEPGLPQEYKGMASRDPGLRRTQELEERS